MMLLCTSLYLQYVYVTMCYMLDVLACVRTYTYLDHAMLTLGPNVFENHVTHDAFVDFIIPSICLCYNVLHVRRSCMRTYIYTLRSCYASPWVLMFLKIM